MEINNEIAGLMAKVLSNEASDDETALLESFLRENPEAGQQFKRLRKIWIAKNDVAADYDTGMNGPGQERLNRIKAKAVSERENVAAVEAEPGIVRLISPRFFKYAAAIAVLVISSIVYLTSDYSPFKQKEYHREEVATENGSRKRVMLPDGTTVLLNSGSRLQFSSDFEGKTREVMLYGEAFFDVVKQPERPFVVHTGAIDIKVLGTAFNVKSYPDDDVVETTLVRGLVQINRTAEKQSRPILLHPNQKVTLTKCSDCDDEEKKIPPKTKIDANAPVIIETLGTGDMEKDWIETAWIHNRLEFRKNSFSEIARKMERWYDVKIHINNETLAGETFNGSFENETLEQALSALQKTTPFIFKIENNEVFIDVPK